MAHFSIALMIAALLLASVAAQVQEYKEEERPRNQQGRRLYVKKDRTLPIQNNREIHSWWHSKYLEFKINQRNRSDIRLLNTHREYARAHDAVIFTSDNYPGQFWNIRRKDRGFRGGEQDEVWKDPVMASPIRIVPGLLGNNPRDCVEDLAEGCVVSFEDAERFGTYLRHTSERIFANENDKTPEFQEDATWIIREALDGDPDARSYESINRPGHYIRHHTSHLRLHSELNLPKEMFRDDCSFEAVGVMYLVENSDRSPPAAVDTR